MKNQIKVEVLTDDVAAGKDLLADLIENRVCLYLNTHRMYDYEIKSTFSSVRQGKNTNLVMAVNIIEIKKETECMKSV